MKPRASIPGINNNHVFENTEWGTAIISGDTYTGHFKQQKDISDTLGRPYKPDGHKHEHMNINRKDHAGM